MATEQQIEAIGSEELARAYPYRLLARLLSSPPDQTVLELVGTLGGGDGPFGEACSALAKAAQEASVASCRQEYQDLFIGVGRGELVGMRDRVAS